MYKIINQKSKFLHKDICRDRKSGLTTIVDDVRLNRGQTEDFHQWNYSVFPDCHHLINKVAWYDMEELVYLSDIFRDEDEPKEFERR